MGRWQIPIVIDQVDILSKETLGLGVLYIWVVVIFGAYSRITKLGFIVGNKYYEINPNQPITHYFGIYLSKNNNQMD